MERTRLEDAVEMVKGWDAVEGGGRRRSKGVNNNSTPPCTLPALYTTLSAPLFSPEIAAKLSTAGYLHSHQY